MRSGDRPQVKSWTITSKSANVLITITKRGETYEVVFLSRCVRKQTTRPCLRRLARHHHNCLEAEWAHTGTTSGTACLACSIENNSTLLKKQTNCKWWKTWLAAACSDLPRGKLLQRLIDKPFNQKTESGASAREELIKILQSTSPSFREWRPLTGSFHLCWPRTKVSFSYKWRRANSSSGLRDLWGRPYSPTSLNQAK